MRWCSADTVAELITTARLSGTVNAADRKAADLALLALCSERSNVGDALVEIAVSVEAPVGLRLNAALAAQPLITRDGWSGQGQFHHPQVVAAALLAYATQTREYEAGGTAAKVADALSACLAAVVALEYPSDQWTQWVMGVAIHASQSGGSGAHLLVTLADVAAANASLWYFLASSVAELVAGSWLVSLEGGGSTLKMEGLRLLLRLMQRRPRPSLFTAAGTPPAGPESCFLLSASMTDAVIRELEQCVDAAPSRAVGPGARVYFAECEAALAIAQRLVRSADSSAKILCSAAFFASSCRGLYSSPDVDISGPVASLIESALECLLSVQQTYPDVAAMEAVAVRDLPQTLVCLMMPRRLESAAADGSFECMDVAAQDLATLCELVMDDEIVPLGCSSGDIPSLASAVMELFLEANPDRAPLCVEMMLSIAATAQRQLVEAADTSAALALVSAAGRALRSSARVFVDKDVSLLDSMSPAGSQGLATAYAALLEALCASAGAQCSRASTERVLSTTALLLEAFSLCFVHCTSAGLCDALLGLVEGIYTITALHSGSSVNPLSWISVYVVGRLLTETRLPADSPASAELVKKLASVEWLSRALTAMMTAAGPAGLLPILCGGTVANAILAARAAPARAQLAADAGGLQLLAASLVSLCQQCQTRAAAELLTRLLTQCAAHTASTHDAEAALMHPLYACLTAVDAAVHGAAAGDSQRETLLRAMSNFVVDLARSVCAQAVCANCACPLLRACLPVVCAGAEQPQLFLDEGGSRSRCAAIATSILALHTEGGSEVSPAEAALAAAAIASISRGAAAQALPAPTVSSCFGHLAALRIGIPHVTLVEAVVDSAAAALPFIAVPGDNVSATEHCSFSRRPIAGVNHLGECLLLSVRLLRDPSDAAAFMRADAEGRRLPSSKSCTAEHGGPAAVLAWSFSLLPFADDFTAAYILAGFLRLLHHYAMSPGPERSLAALMLPEGCPLCYLPSVLVKSVPPANYIVRASLADAMAFAAIATLLRHKRTTKVRLLAPELVDRLSLAEHWPALTGQPVSEPLATILSGPSSTVGMCEYLLHELASLGYESAFPAIREFVTSRMG